MKEMFNKKKTVNLISIIFAALLSFSANAAGTLDKIAQTGTINIGFDLTWPFAYFDNKNKAIGYTVEICEKIADAVRRELKRPDIVIKYKTLKTSDRLPAVISGDIDLECGSTTNNANRRKEVAFAIPTFIAEVRMLVHKDSSVKSIMDLAGKRVVVNKGSTSEDIVNDLNKRISLRATPAYAPTIPESFAMFASGKADAFILDDILLYGQRSTAKNPGDMVITKNPLSLEVIAIMMRKNDPELKKLVDTELVRIIMDGEINTIYKKWFQSPIPPNNMSLNYPMSRMLRESFKAPTDWAPD